MIAPWLMSMLCAYDGNGLQQLIPGLTNSRGFVSHGGPVGLLRMFVTFKFKTPQTHIFKLCGFVSMFVVGFGFKFSLWVYGLVLYINIVKGQPRFHGLNAEIVQWLTSCQGLLQILISACTRQ